jgi:thiol-disulfide isomerase/thioredoxin
LSNKALRGKVVLVNFWTYSCINSLRELPYMKAWAEKYKDAGLVVVGVHAPEFGFQKDPANVKNAVADLEVPYPVLIDSDHSIWRAFRNEYWPADYIFDAKGRIRYHHFGEGEYEKSERVIQSLLRENGATGLDESTVRITADGVRRHRVKMDDHPKPTLAMLARRTSRRRSGWRQNHERPTANRRGQH